MNHVRKIAYFSKLVARKTGTDRKATHKIITQCVKNLEAVLRKGEDDVITDNIHFTKNKQAALDHFNNKKQQNT